MPVVQPILLLDDADAVAELKRLQQGIDGERCMFASIGGAGSLVDALAWPCAKLCDE